MSLWANHVNLALARVLFLKALNYFVFFVYFYIFE